jgi:hypothetical protein
MRSILPMCDRRLRPIMGNMLATGSATIDAERAFRRAARGRRRAAVLRWVRRWPACCGQLAVVGMDGLTTAGRTRAAEIPLCEILATLEPSRASQFDGDFRPAPIARPRWERVWLAEHRGAPLPPISVVKVDGGYALRDGHHRVSVARARGALAIDAVVEHL